MQQLLPFPPAEGSKRTQGRGKFLLRTHSKCRVEPGLLSHTCSPSNNSSHFDCLPLTSNTPLDGPKICSYLIPKSCYSWLWISSEKFLIVFHFVMKQSSSHTCHICVWLSTVTIYSCSCWTLHKSTIPREVPFMSQTSLLF